MTIELWDVLSVLTHVILHLHVGENHAWPAIAVICGICGLHRDLEIHEVVAAVYVLRFACNTIVLDGVIAYVPCLAVALVSAYAHLDTYMELDYAYRRATLYVTVIMAVMIRYTWNTSAELSIARLIVYTLLTRRARAVLKQDSWDSAVQCIAVLCAPSYFLALPVAWPFMLTAFDWYNASHTFQSTRLRSRRIRMREGILEEVV